MIDVVWVKILLWWNKAVIIGSRATLQISALDFDKLLFGSENSVHIGAVLGPPHDGPRYFFITTRHFLKGYK